MSSYYRYRPIIENDLYLTLNENEIQSCYSDYLKNSHDTTTLSRITAERQWHYDGGNIIELESDDLYCLQLCSKYLWEDFKAYTFREQYQSYCYLFPQEFCFRLCHYDMAALLIARIGDSTAIVWQDINERYMGTNYSYNEFMVKVNTELPITKEMYEIWKLDEKEHAIVDKKRMAIIAHVLSDGIESLRSLPVSFMQEW